MLSSSRIEFLSMMGSGSVIVAVMLNKMGNTGDSFFFIAVVLMEKTATYLVIYHSHARQQQ